MADRGGVARGRLFRCAAPDASRLAEHLVAANSGAVASRGAGDSVRRRVRCRFDRLPHTRGLAQQQTLPFLRTVGVFTDSAAVARRGARNRAQRDLRARGGIGGQRRLHPRPPAGVLRGQRDRTADGEHQQQHTGGKRRSDCGLHRLARLLARFFFFVRHLPCSRFSPRLHFATFFAVFFGAIGVVIALGVGGSGWVMGGVKDTPSSEPPGEVVGGPPEGVVEGALAVVNVSVSPTASCHLFSARRR